MIKLLWICFRVQTERYCGTESTVQKVCTCRWISSIFKAPNRNNNSICSFWKGLVWSGVYWCLFYQNHCDCWPQNVFDRFLSKPVQVSYQVGHQSDPFVKGSYCILIRLLSSYSYHFAVFHSFRFFVWGFKLIGLYQTLSWGCSNALIYLVAYSNVEN